MTRLEDWTYRAYLAGTDVTCYLAADTRISWGRLTRADQPEASTCTLTMRDEVGAVNPLIGQSVAVDAVYAGTAYPRFRGTVSSAEVGTGYDEVVVVASGPLAKLGRTMVDVPWTAEFDGARIERILTGETLTPTVITVETEITPDNAGTATWQEHPANWRPETQLDFDDAQTQTGGSIDFGSITYAGTTITKPGTAHVFVDLGASGVRGMVNDTDRWYYFQFPASGGPYKLWNMTSGTVTFGPSGVEQTFAVKLEPHDPSGLPSTAAGYFQASPTSADRTGSMRGNRTAYPNRGWMWSAPLTPAEYRGQLDNPSDLVPQMRPFVGFAERAVGITSTTGWKLRLTCTARDPALDQVWVYFEKYTANIDGEYKPYTGTPGGPTNNGTVLNPVNPFGSAVMLLPVASLPVGEQVEFDVHPLDMGDFRDYDRNSVKFVGATAAGAPTVAVTFDHVSLIRTTTTTESGPLAGDIDDGWVTIAERTIVSGTDTRSKLDLMREAAISALGIVLETFDGHVSYQDAQHRQPRAEDMTLDCVHILKEMRWRDDIADLLNDLAYTYGDQHHADAATFKGRVQDTTSIAAFGTYGSNVYLALSNSTDAATVANQLIAWRKNPFWTMETLPVRLETVPDVALALTAHISALLELTNIPEPTPAVGGLWWLEGAEETLSVRGWSAGWYVSPFDVTVIPA